MSGQWRALTLEQSIAKYGNIGISVLKTLCKKENLLIALPSARHGRVAITRRYGRIGESDYCGNRFPFFQFPVQRDAFLRRFEKRVDAPQVRYLKFENLHKRG
ncbi:hypothetical protein [Paraburkholderia sacchari]|uniref:hypothetical protein n=1 Tax=Paraburkholderia sacchari TaxID=159450 RepID=UPI0039A46579